MTNKIVVAASLMAFALALAACGAESATQGSSEAERGASLIAATGCGACHAIPGIEGATGNVGPPLQGIGRRAYIAGVLRNSPDNLARWIAHPQQAVPGNAMPDMGINESDARAMAAYLETLR
jgi:cytochrome c